VLPGGFGHARLTANGGGERFVQPRLKALAPAISGHILPYRAIMLVGRKTADLGRLRRTAAWVSDGMAEHSVCEPVLLRATNLLLRANAALGASDSRLLWQLPTMPATVAPLVYAVPVQLIAYHTAVIMGTDVDQPRNLASQRHHRLAFGRRCALGVGHQDQSPTAGGDFLHVGNGLVEDVRCGAISITGIVSSMSAIRPCLSSPAA
jgi:hypothetical protein